LFVPIHWSDATSSSGAASRLVGSNTDPFSGQPETKATPAAIAPVSYAYRGFVLSREAPAPSSGWWARLAVNGGFGMLIATDDGPDKWCARARASGSGAELAEFMDGLRGIYRAAAFRDGALQSVLFIGPAQCDSHWDSLTALFQSQTLTETQRRALLSGRSIDGIAEAGPLICACFAVGRTAILKAIAGGCASVDAIGKSLRAGTNCGSCLPELKKIIYEQVPVPV
jgi:assimilatory nitrate reductase catalytic subunit